MSPKSIVSAIRVFSTRRRTEITIGAARCADFSPSPISRVRRTPEIPRGDGAIGPPSFAELGDFLGLWPMRQAIGGFYGALQSEIVDGQNVRAIQDENQEHLGRPAADAFDGGQGVDHFLIAELGEPMVGDGAA